MKVSATEVLRRHAIERHLRAGIRSGNLDGDAATSVARMTQGQWIESCALTARVPAELLELLGVYHCESAGWSWREDEIELQGQRHRVRVERETIPLTLVEAAERVGLRLTYKELRALRLAGIAAVQDNLIARAERGDVAA